MTISPNPSDAAPEPPRGHVRVVYLGPVAPHWEVHGVFGDNRVIDEFRQRAVARLQLGRAYALSGETTKAKTAYQDFFTLWKDADPDIPILKQAKVEYARLP